MRPTRRDFLQLVFGLASAAVARVLPFQRAPSVLTASPGTVPVSVGFNSVREGEVIHLTGVKSIHSPAVDLIVDVTTHSHSDMWRPYIPVPRDTKISFELEFNKDLSKKLQDALCSLKSSRFVVDVGDGATYEAEGIVSSLIHRECPVGDKDVEVTFSLIARPEFIPSSVYPTRTSFTPEFDKNIGIETADKVEDDIVDADFEYYPDEFGDEAPDDED